ncbi:hypothetical protein A143_09700 [Vibrio splendidus ZS-139]|nr:hypothetical protein A143_09700 [Vibrio splendidus ZS-139]
MIGFSDSLIVQEDYDITDELTMGIGGKVKAFIRIESLEELECAYQNVLSLNSKFLVVGGGSNVIFSSQGFDGAVFSINIKGIDEVSRSETHVLLDVGAGEDWEDFVDFSLENHYWGVENLTLIPGTVGACPVQNVGAFGQEVKNIIEHVECFDTVSQKIVVINNQDCLFSFRKSIFNSTEKDRYIITSVRFRLSLVPSPRLHRQEFSKLRNYSGDSQQLQNEIRKLVIDYRTSGINLPNDKAHGCSGTFFRTAVVSSYTDFIKIACCTLRNLGLKAAIMMILFCIKYRSQEGFRIPSKRLIQFCNICDLRVGSVFLLPSNPAVVVSDLNNSPCSEDLVELVALVRDKVYNRTGVFLPIEPELIGFDI